MDTEKTYYQSLPEGLVIRESVTTRHGIFAEKDFKAGYNFGLARVRVNETWVRSGALGSVVNHSNTPNCRMSHYFWGDFEASDLVAFTDIKAGQELSVFYVLEEYSDAPWIDQSMRPDWA